MRLSDFEKFRRCLFISLKSLIPTPVRYFIHDIGVFLFTEKNYYSFKKLFDNFCQRFSIKNIIVCIVIFMFTYIVVLLRRDGRKKRRKHFWDWRAVSAAVLMVYGYLLVLYTLVFRPVYSSPRYQFTLFWSYRKAAGGSVYLTYAIILNYMMLIPIGLLLPIVIEREDNQKKVFLGTMLTGLFTSLLIECLQLLMRRGLFEFDDILGNVVGVMIGYGLYKLARRWKKGKHK